MDEENAACDAHEVLKREIQIRDENIADLQATCSQLEAEDEREQELVEARMVAANARMLDIKLRMKTARNSGFSL